MFQRKKTLDPLLATQSRIHCKRRIWLSWTDVLAPFLSAETKTRYISFEKSCSSVNEDVSFWKPNKKLLQGDHSKFGKSQSINPQLRPQPTVQLRPVLWWLKMAWKAVLVFGDWESSFPLEKAASFLDFTQERLFLLLGSSNYEQSHIWAYLSAVWSAIPTTVPATIRSTMKRPFQRYVYRCEKRRSCWVIVIWSQAWGISKLYAFLWLMRVYFLNN